MYITAWMVTGKQTINGAEYTTDDSGALRTVAKPTQPTQPTIPNQPTEPAKPAITLSDADKQTIVDELKPYIDQEINSMMKK